MSIEIHQPTPEPNEGPSVSAVPSLHGKTVKLIRGGEEVVGVLLSKDTQGPSKNMSFKWKSKAGSACVSEVTEEEIDTLLNG